ncbi:aromatic acid exporter family protein [Plantactinospora sp. BC1]|uniref:FUSC family protein n=1 Tax=Plantactinospora sp. BC1 TaxID=2108470 RepID=UPI001F3BB9D1|nr:FUSC family protein [Plantactinospora sp. BC1]
MPPRPHYRSPLAAAVQRMRGTAGRARYEGRQATRLRVRQLEIIAVIAVQAGLAAGLSWWIAHNLLGNPGPVFAPTAAVGTIVAAIGQRARRTVELLAGVGLGIVIGDGLIFLIGTGPWQTAVIVTLAIGVALGLVGRGGTVVSQVGGTAVLIATLSPTERDLELPRIVDAAVGSAVGLVVVALLLPLNPIRVVNRAAAPVFAILIGRLRDTGAALRERDVGRATQALDGLRGIEPDLRRLREAVSGAEEVVRVAPLRWRRRQEFERHARGVTELTRVIEGARDLARRAITVVDYREPIPHCLPDAIEMLASAVQELQHQARIGRDTGGASRRALVAARQGGRARREGLHNFGDALVTQLRVCAADILRATGCPSRQAGRAVRRAARDGERAKPAYDDVQ